MNNQFQKPVLFLLALLMFCGCGTLEKENIDDPSEEFLTFSSTVGLAIPGDSLLPCPADTDRNCYFSALFLSFHYSLDNLSEEMLNEDAKIEVELAVMVPGEVVHGESNFVEVDGFCLDSSVGVSTSDPTVLPLDTNYDPEESVSRFSLLVNLPIVPHQRNATLAGGICIMVETLDPISNFLPTLVFLGHPQLLFQNGVEIKGRASSVMLNSPCEDCMP